MSDHIGASELAPPASPTAAGTTDLRAEGVSLAYGSRVVVPAIDVTIPTGRITVVVGANACGKSTLLRGLGRLLKPAAGSVLLDGRDIHSLPTREVATRLGLLPQSPTAPDGITVADLVGRGRFPTSAGIASGHPTTRPPSLEPWP